MQPHRRYVRGHLAADRRPPRPGASVSDVHVQLLSGTIGAVIRGIDARTVGGEATAAIRSALVQRKVVFLPEQHLTPAELVAFAARFGELTPAHPVMPGLDGQPEVLEVDATRSRQDPR